MPEISLGLNKIKAYMDENHILAVDLATAYGIKKGDFADILNGKDTSPRANRVIIKIISDFKIR
ncbi:XRE family transcriptional regulator [Lactococcus lactis]|uniref:Transcriptional regulator n=1 Tax=Lactococcus lactis TaxID=1358 RepID=A0AAW5TKC1_9LACT|nr:XRE family transcriptional regulator [Lactococcus lactis]MCW2280446.1 hypothetical protein [Lactococcus lactis]